jgi:hypothetical protein
VSASTILLPKALTLPSGRRIELRLDANAKVSEALAAGPRVSSAAMGVAAVPKFTAAMALLGTKANLSGIDVKDLALGDFHVLRALLLKQGLLDEEEIEIDCSNCAEILRVKACANLEMGPWEDGEANDPELDRTLPFDEPIPTDGGELVLSKRTVRHVEPLFKALASPQLEIDAAVVTAMGIVSLAGAKDPATIATALMECDDAVFASITNAWLDAHYVPRLASDFVCPKCNAKNTGDAPYLREFDRGLVRGESRAPAVPLPPLADFVELAHAFAEPLLQATPEPPELIVEDGTPAVDDGGVPLLGSYLPPPPKDAPVPMNAGSITLYYRTFEACVADEPGFDWETELRETIEHELEHHVYYLRGDDPMDDAERAAIAAEAVRLVGRSEAARRELKGFAGTFPDFLRRAWPLIVLAAFGLIVAIANARCTPGSR